MRLALAALAATALLGAAPRPPAKPLVIFFGGYASTPADMTAWAIAARRSIYGKTFDFQAIAYPPNVSFVESDAVKADSVIIEALAGQIDASPNRKFVVVGHSSGAGLAAALIERVRNGGRKNLRMVILDDGVDDGFKPPPGFDADRQVECWSAVNGPMAASNREQTQAFCRNYHELKSATCRTAYCLHFSVVNLGAPADLTENSAFVIHPNGTTGGYQNLKVNLSWLDSSIAP